MAYKMRSFSDDELIRRVWDQEEIRKVIHRFAYYEAAGRRGEALDRFWVSSPELQASVSFGRNWGFLEGMDDIRDYYVGRCRFGAPGTVLMHPLSTKLLCLAEDGKTAQGIWMGIAYEISPDENDELQACWISERVAVDFILEDGVWKIWHMFVGTNFVLPTGESYAQQPLRTRTVTRAEGSPHWYNLGLGREVAQGEVALFDQIPGYPERERFLDGREPEEIYTALYNDPLHFPPLPQPYPTYQAVPGYDRAGFLACSVGSQGKV